MALQVVTPTTEQEKYLNTLLYGPPKTGKTAGACSGPGRTLILNADLPNATHFAHLRSDRLDEIHYTGFQTLVDVALEVQHQDTWNTIVVDPVGELYRRMLEELSNRAVRPPIQTYGDVAIHLERWCRALCEAPINVVFTAHDNVVTSDGDEGVLHLPFTGSRSNPTLGNRLMSMVDVFGYTGVLRAENEPPKYMVQLIEERGRLGGDRTNALGPFREVNLTEWHEVIAAHEAAQQGAMASAKE